ncbi:MAG: DUF2948 family protein [Silicimonas sp.]|nr:DUF2948 family protein [Silicimonas sp.]
MADARFEDGDDKSLRLIAADADDLQVISTLVQDAVCPGSEMKWRKSQRRFAVLINRFRWEDQKVAKRIGRAAERVQSMLVFDDVLRVAAQGVQAGDTDTILSVLSISFEPAEDGAGSMILTLAGDGAIKLDVEAINVTLQDVTRPYEAPSGKSPSHPV